MSKIFKYTGIGVLILSIFTFFYAAGHNLPMAFISLLFTAVLGASFIAISNLMERLAYLEDKLGVSLISNNSELPQKVCPNCSVIHDFDYPKCPNCNHVY